MWSRLDLWMVWNKFDLVRCVGALGVGQFRENCLEYVQLCGLDWGGGTAKTLRAPRDAGNYPDLCESGRKGRKGEKGVL